MTKIYTLIFTLLIGVGTINAQSLKRFKIKAVEAFEAKDFSRALEYYQLIINDAEDETAENYYNAGEAAREFRVYELAEQYYRQVLIDTASNNGYQLTNFHLASVLKSQGRYDEAIQYYQKFLDRNATFVGETYSENAHKEIEDCRWASDLPENGAQVLQLDSNINTANSEFSPIVLGNELYYSSVRYNTDADNLPKTPLTRIYISKNSQLGKEISADFNEDLKHSAHATFNPDGSTIYYTICNSLNATDVKCKIYYREKNGDVWGQRIALPDNINLENYNTTQPAVGYDQTTNREVIFFVSDRPAEDGDTSNDLNIWCSFRDGDVFGTPGVISNIQTKENDITPYFDSEAQTLFFSSNGRRNMGGYDIYSIKRDGNGWGIIEHMGAPINSSYDDVYYSTNTDGTMAYLSSNRKGAVCDDENGLCGCNDIFEIPTIKIKVLTYNKITGEPLFGTEVTLDELKNQISNVKSNANGHTYDYSGSFNLEYFVGATLDGYVHDDSTFNTMNVQGGSVIEIPLYLTPAVELDALTFNKVTGEPLAGVTVELLEVPNDLYDESLSLDSKYGPNDIQYNYGLNFGKRYMVVGSKPGYSRDTFFVRTDTIDIIPTKLLDKLYLCKTPPGPELVRLYFYNDEPNRRTRSPNTDWSYAKAYESYQSLRQEFNVAFAYDPEELSNIERFFEEDVKKGYEDLQKFSEVLKGYLDQMKDGEILEVEIRGFASPRAKNDYNLNLTSRRIKSIENYFNSIGLLNGYEGRIRVKPISNGEETAKDKGISDDIADRKNSVYSVAASKERRVEIIRILIAPDACAPDVENK